MIKRARTTTVTALGLLALAACSSTSETGPAAGAATGPGTGPNGQRPAGAILVAQRFTTPDGRAAYMGAFPDMPETDVDVSQMVELGPEGDVFACGGYGFFYDPDAGRITRYEVGDDLRLTKGPSIDVLQEGITGWTGAHVCASPTQAFIFNESGGRIVEWNPTEMLVVSAFDVPKPEVKPGLTLQFFEPHKAGDLVYFGVTAINWDTMEIEPRAILAVFDIATKTLSFDYDDRCQPSLGGFVDSAGNYYQLPEDGGYWASYGSTTGLPRDCVLRVSRGKKTFDDDYVQYLAEGQSLRSMWPVDDDHMLATVIPMSSAPPKEKSDEWFDLPVEPTLFDLRTGAQTPYPHVPTTQPMNSRKLVIDGKSYYQLYTYDDKGRTSKVELVQLTRDAAPKVFTLVGGDFLTVERLW